MPFDESMGKYGNDKPDLRFGLPHTDLTALVIDHVGGGVAVLEAHRREVHERPVPPRPARRDRQGPAHPRRARASSSRAELDKLEEFVKGMGAKGLARAKVGERGELDAVAAREDHHARAARGHQRGRAARSDGDLLFFQFGRESLVHTVMANLRVHLAKKLGLIPEYGHGGKWNFLWVVNPPLFEYDEDTKTLGGGAPRLHAPARRVTWSCSRRTRARCSATATTSCSTASRSAAARIRLHDPEVQAKVFRALGISDEEAREKFGFLLDALKFGAPPHGGIAHRHGPPGDAARRAPSPCAT